MSNYRTRDQVLTAIIESPSGTEGTPTVASNAIKVKDLRHSASLDAIQTNEHQASLTESAPIIGGGFGSFNFGALLKGSGTPGTAPEIDPVIRACGYQAITTGAAVTGTAQAGAASTITLAVGASAVDDAYRGMVITLTGGPGSGAMGVITGYVGSTKVATVAVPWASVPSGATPTSSTTYSIPASNMYRPVTSGLETVTLVGYQNQKTGNSKRRRVIGAAGEMGLQLATRGLLDATFQMRGILPAAPDDVSNPGTPTFQAGEAVPFRSAHAYLGGVLVKLSTLQANTGNTVDQFDDPAAANGYDIGAIMMRSFAGTIVVNEVLTSNRDPFQDWIDSVSRSLWLRWGSVAGKRVSIFMPAIRYTGNEESDVRGFAGRSLPFRSVSPDGEMFLCFH